MSSNPAIADRNAGIGVFLALFVMGVVALGIGLLGYERAVMYSIAIGCAPTGALGAALSIWASRWAARRHPEWIRKKADALDERNVQIRHAAGHTAFWAVYGYIFLYLLLSPTRFLQGVTHSQFGIASILAANAMYWTAMLVYRREY